MSLSDSKVGGKAEMKDTESVARKRKEPPAAGDDEEEQQQQREQDTAAGAICNGRDSRCGQLGFQA